MTWLDHGLGWRNRLLASPRFQRWAAAFPLTRPIARRRARKLFDLCAGFVYSQVLYACVRLKVLEILAENPQTAERLARRIQLPLASTETLLRAASSLGLVEACNGQRYAPGQLGAALLGNPGIGAMVEHHALLYADLQDPVAMLRSDQRGGGQLAGHWPYAGAADPNSLQAERVGDYTSLMSASQPFVAGEILDAYRFEKRGHRCLLDVGGGDGSFLHAVAARNPNLQLMLFDLPAVAARARARFERSEFAARAGAHGGNMLRDPLPRGADVISLVRVIHDHDDDAALTILRAARAALPANGRLLIAEPMSATRGAEPVGDAYFGIYLMAMGSGRPRTPRELGDLLRAAGFERIRLLRTHMPMLTRLLVARPASD